MPLFYVFPHVHFKNHFLRSSAPGSGGTAHSTGWMIESTFVEQFNHFLKFGSPSIMKPVMLVFDNHEIPLSV